MIEFLSALMFVLLVLIFPAIGLVAFIRGLIKVGLAKLAMKNLAVMTITYFAYEVLMISEGYTRFDLLIIWPMILFVIILALLTQLVECSQIRSKLKKKAH